MSIRVYFSRGGNYIPDEKDYICTFSQSDCLEMKPAFDVFENRTGYKISSKQKTDITATSVGALIESLYDLVPHQKKSSKLEAIDRLNGVAQEAREKGFGLSFYGVE